MPTIGMEKPKNADMLKDMLDRMAEVDIKHNPKTNRGLDKLLSLVMIHMERAGNIDIPVSVAQIQYVIKELSI